ncbi:MAG: lactonase family protein [Bacilli bacterium]
MGSFIIGTYGDFFYKIILQNEKLTIEQATPAKNPTYIAKSDSGKLYTVYRTTESGGVAVYDEVGQMQQVIETVGKGPCHLHLNANQTRLYASHYHEGLVVEHQLNNQGAIIHSIHHPFLGQKQAKMHWCGTFSDGSFVCADLGNNRLYISNEVLQLPDNTGLRHVVILNDETLYCVGEYSGTVYAVKKSPSGWDNVDSCETTTSNEDAGAAAIRLSPCERYIYISLRSSNEIVLIAKDPSLHVVSRQQLKGNGPRDFAISSCGGYCVVANQHSGTVDVYARNPHGGELSRWITDIHISQAVCVLTC